MALDKEELIDKERIIFSHNATIHIDTEEYKISKPLPYLNPLWARILDGRGWKNKILYIHGKIYLTNYRIIFEAKKEKFSWFSIPHDMGNAIKNRLYGKIDIFLCDIALITRFKHLTNRGFNIHTNKGITFKFSIFFISLLNVIKQIEKAKIYEIQTNNRNVVPATVNKLKLNHRLEKHNRYWSNIGKFIGIINIPFQVINLIFNTPFYILFVFKFVVNFFKKL